MLHHNSRKHLQSSSDRNGLNLEGYIYVDKERITRRRILFHGINFYLDKDILQKIQHAQESGDSLQISRELLADLRYYALTNGENGLQSGLTFCTYYLRQGSQDALMRSVISIDGDIIHQIKNDCLERPDFCSTFVSAHFWLIDQLLGQLRMRAFVKLNQLSWGLAVVIVVVTMIPYIQQLIQANPWTLLIPIVMSWLLQVILKRLLRLLLPIMSRWILRRILAGVLSRKSWKKTIARGILARLN